jgi:hypothetical protein
MKNGRLCSLTLDNRQETVGKALERLEGHNSGGVPRVITARTIRSLLL